MGEFNIHSNDELCASPTHIGGAHDVLRIDMIDERLGRPNHTQSRAILSDSDT